MMLKEKFLGLWLRFLTYWSWVFKQYSRLGCLTKAASLALTSLFALVPLLLVVFSILRLLPGFESIQGQVENFILNNLAPAAGQALVNRLDLFTSTTAGLPLMSTLTLFITSLLMMRGVERVLNEIWQARQKRPWISAFLLYWTVLTLGPLLLGGGIAASSYVLSLRWIDEVSTNMITVLLLSWLPFLLNVLMFTFVYTVVPHVRVKIKHALLGALITAVLFQIARGIFSWYVFALPTYQLIYGTLALIPIFILWIVISWQLFLLGAVCVHGFELTNHQKLNQTMSPFEATVIILKKLHQAQLTRQNYDERQLFQHCSQVPYQYLKQGLASLIEYHYVEVSENGLVLNCHVERETLKSLYENLQLYLGLDENIDQQVDFTSIKASMQNLLNQPLSAVFK